MHKNMKSKWLYSLIMKQASYSQLISARLQIINFCDYWIILQQLMRLGKQNTGTETHPEESSTFFFLKRIGAPVNGPSVQVDFSPKAPSSPQETQELENLQNIYRAYPMFNRDAKYFTPAFSLEEDSMKISKNLESYLNLHKARSTQAEEEKAQIYVPKPSKGNSYCSICKTIFEDYLTHLNMPKHKQNLNSGIFCKQIQDLCQRFIQKKKKIVKIEKPVVKRTTRRCRATKEDLNETTYTINSTPIEQFPIQKAA